MTVEGVMHYEVIAVLVCLVPMILLFRRVGLSIGWSVILLAPYFGLLICLCILAFAPWPKLPHSVFRKEIAYVAIVGTIAGMLLREVGFVLFFAIALPAWTLVRRAGFSGWRVVWIFLPIANIVAAWTFCFVRWPVFAEHAKQAVETDEPTSARPSV